MCKTAYGLETPASSAATGDIPANLRMLSARVDNTEAGAPTTSLRKSARDKEHILAARDCKARAASLHSHLFRSITAAMQVVADVGGMACLGASHRHVRVSGHRSARQDSIPGQRFSGRATRRRASRVLLKVVSVPRQ